MGSKMFVTDIVLCAISLLLFIFLSYVTFKVTKLIKFNDLTLLFMLLFLCGTLLGNLQIY